MKKLTFFPGKSNKSMDKFIWKVHKPVEKSSLKQKRQKKESKNSLKDVIFNILGEKLHFYIWAKTMF